MNKRKIRDSLRLTQALLLFWLYIPHMTIYLINKRRIIDSDIERLKMQVNISLPNWLAVLYFLHNSSYYRSVFYYRLGPVISLIISWYRPRNNYFIIPDSMTIGGGHLFCPSICYCIKCRINRCIFFMHALYNVREKG